MAPNSAYTRDYFQILNLQRGSIYPVLLASQVFSNTALTEESQPTAFRVSKFYKENTLIATAFYHVDFFQFFVD